MKRVTAILLFALLLLSGCVASSKQTVTVNLVKYTVNTQNHTISDGTNTYVYLKTGTGTDTNWTSTLTINYPDGSAYSYTEYDKDGVVTDEESWMGQYDSQYAAPADLKAALEMVSTKRNVRVDAGRLIGGIACVVIGVVGLCFPTLGFYLRYGLYVENAEPTDFYLFMARIGAAACVVLGIVISVMAFT